MLKKPEDLNHNSQIFVLFKLMRVSFRVKFLMNVSLE